MDYGNIDYFSLVDESFLERWQNYIQEWQKAKFDDYFENSSEDLHVVYKLKLNDVAKALYAKSEDEKLFCQAMIASWVAINMIQYKNKEVPFMITAEGVPEEMIKAAHKDTENVNQSSSGGGCFIATATFEDYNAPEVILLRKWRDETLMKSLFGQLIVQIYYIISPSISFIISKSRILRNIAKSLLLRMINKIK